MYNSAQSVSFKSLQPDIDNRDKSMTNPKWLSDGGSQGVAFWRAKFNQNFSVDKVTIEIYGTGLSLTVSM